MINKADRSNTGSQRRFDSDPRLPSIFNELRRKCSSSVTLASGVVVFLTAISYGIEVACIAGAMGLCGFLFGVAGNEGDE